MILEVDTNIAFDDEPVCALWSSQGKITVLAYLYQLANYKNESLFPLCIEMPCGEKYIFKNEDSIPLKSLPCRCKDEMHFVFKYFHN
jgi:hypothetical protein